MIGQSPAPTKIPETNPKIGTAFTFTATIIDIDTVSNRSTMKIYYQRANGIRKTEWFWVNNLFKTKLQIKLGQKYCIGGIAYPDGKSVHAITPATK